MRFTPGGYRSLPRMQRRVSPTQGAPRPRRFFGTDGLPSRRRVADHRHVLTKAELQRLRSLREKKNREALGLFVVEGEKVVAELLTAQFPLRELYATPDWPGWSTLRTPPEGAGAAAGTGLAPQPTAISDAEMTRISHFPTPSTVLAVGAILRTRLAPGALDRGLTLALDGVQDAGNVGTILRVADWFGFDRVILSADCADVFHQKVINASMGSFARIATHTVDLPAALAGVAPGTSVFGCDLAGTSVYALAPVRDAVVVIGSEGRGLSAPVAARIGQRVTIPRFGQAESLNAGVAAAIVCAQLRRTG